MTDPLDLIYERVLVVRCQAGDEAALAELAARYDARLRYFLRKLAAEQADDLLQDVWLDVFRQLPRLRDPQAFRAWVYRIARDRALAALHRARRGAQPLGDLDVPDGQPEEGGFDEEDAQRIHAALDRLPAEQREVLVLRFVESMSYEEIAAVTGLAIGTVRSRLYYGKQALRKQLEN
jgi:RNA polymerase sigma-70 factor (ECF subfamily)